LRLNLRCKEIETSLGSVLDSFVSKDITPETCNLVRVADFNYVKLLLYSFVKSKFFFLDLGDDVSSQIDCTQVQQLLVRFNVTLSAFHLVG